MAYEGTTILLAEDDVILSELYTERLRQEGFTVVHANNGEEALQFVHDYNPSLIILDIMMPKMNGLDVLKNLKESPATKNIPVIIVTALVQEIEKLNKIMTQADAYIVKSEVLPGEIIEEVKKRLNKPAADMGTGAVAPTPQMQETVDMSGMEIIAPAGMGEQTPSVAPAESEDRPGPTVIGA
jgi:DNA-binding response OmpR family regulator